MYIRTQRALAVGVSDGADMIEVDVSMTIDGVFFAFHNGEEKVELGVQSFS